MAQNDQPQWMDGVIVNVTIFRNRLVPQFWAIPECFGQHCSSPGYSHRIESSMAQTRSYAFLGGVEWASISPFEAYMFFSMGSLVPPCIRPSGQGKGTQLHALHQVQAGIRAWRKWTRCRNGVWNWCRDGAMKIIRCRDGVFYWRRDGAMKIIRCRDSVLYWRRDGAKNK